MAIDLALNEHQQLLQRSAFDFFQNRCPTSVVREIEAGTVGYQPKMWQEMADLGWLGITFPESYGGGGGNFLDLYPLYEEMGRFLVPSPHLDTVVVVGGLLLEAGSDAQKLQMLPAIVDGRCIVSPAIVESGGAFGPGGVLMTATRRGPDYVLTGTKLLVGYVPSADYLLCVARTCSTGSSTGVTVFLIEASAAGISSTPLQNIAGNALYAVEFDNVIVTHDAIVGATDDGWNALATATTRAAVLQTVSIIGAARAVLEMTNQYAKDRVQFGNPIGKYQAVQYMVSDILFDLHNVELLAKQAAFRIDAGKTFGREAAMAIAHGKRAAARLHRQAHEVHAGVGYMLEHDLNLFSRRSKFWENNLGDARYYLEELAREMQL